MIIQRLELENFRPFCGRQTIDLTPDDNRSLILIRALNDVGKTSLFRALNFCLYGERRKGELAKLVNRKAALTGNGTMSVRMVFSHDGKQYEIIRSIGFRKTLSPERLPDLIGDDKLTVLRDGDTLPLKSVEDQNEFIESLLPSEASQFFFFDGEKIQDYTRHPPRKRVREAIEIVLGIRELLNAREDLQQVYDDLRRELNRLLREQSKDKDEAAELERLEVKIRDIRERLTALDQDLADAKQAVKECDSLLEKAEEIKVKILRRKTLEEQLERAKNELENIQNEQRSFNRYAGPLLLAPALQHMRAFGGGEPRTPEWQRQAAIHILESQDCICGRPVTTDVVAKLKPLTERQVKTRLQLIAEASTNLLLKLEPDSKERELVNLIRKRTETEANQRAWRAERDKLHEEVRGVNIEDYKRIEERRFRAQQDLERFERERQEKEEELAEYERDFTARQKRLAGRTVSQEVQAKQRAVDACQLLGKAVEQVISRLVDSRRGDVEQLASNVFKKLTNNPELYEGIVIDPEYALKVKTIGGIVRPVWDQDPSAGASQIIATSFIAALNRFTAREAPIVIDTPIGRLDPIHKKNLLDFYPELGPQVVILYQPEELEDGDVARIRHVVSQEWEIQRPSGDPDVSVFRRIR